MSPELIPFVVPRSATLLDVVTVIEANHCRCAIVTHDEKVIGVISDGDIMRALLRGADIHSLLEPLIKFNFKFLKESSDKTGALELFREHGFGLVPIINEDFHLTGVITLRNMLTEVTLLEAQQS